MTQKPQDQTHPRAERLATALRENLRKRKQQKIVRTAEEHDSDATNAEKDRGAVRETRELPTKAD